MLAKLKRLLGRAPEQATRIQLLSGMASSSGSIGRSAWESDVFRAAVDAIARNASKLSISHNLNWDNQKTLGDHRLNRLLKIRPNPYMTASDWIYKTVAAFYSNNNAFSYIQKDSRGEIVALWPLVPNQVEFVTDSTNTLYCRFLFSGGETVIIPYEDVFHIRRMFFQNDLLGDSNFPINAPIELASVQTEGLSHAVKSGANIRGILRFNQVINQENMKAQLNTFIENYLSVANSSGVVALDSKAEYTPLNGTAMTIEAEQIRLVEEKIYKYLGVSPEIVKGDYTEDQYSAFMESVLEPLGLQMGLELTAKIFTEREQAFGNRIEVASSRMIFASNKTKVTALEKLIPMGLLTKNQGLEVLNLPTVEGGDIYLQSLNYIDQTKANKYQVGEDENDEGNQNREIDS